MRTKKVDFVEFMGKYRLSADSLNIILQEKKHSKKGIDSWSNIAFFSNPKNALDYIMEKEIREVWVDDLKQVVKGMERLHKAIDNLKLQPLPQVVRAKSSGF